MSESNILKKEIVRVASGSYYQLTFWKTPRDYVRQNSFSGYTWVHQGKYDRSKIEDIQKENRTICVSSVGYVDDFEDIEDFERFLKMCLQTKIVWRKELNKETVQSVIDEFVNENIQISSDMHNSYYFRRIHSLEALYYDLHFVTLEDLLKLQNKLLELAEQCENSAYKLSSEITFSVAAGLDFWIKKFPNRISS